MHHGSSVEWGVVGAGGERGPLRGGGWYRSGTVVRKCAAGFGRRAQHPDRPAVGLCSAAAVCQLPGVRTTPYTCTTKETGRDMIYSTRLLYLIPSHLLNFLINKQTHWLVVLPAINTDDTVVQKEPSASHKDTLTWKHRRLRRVMALFSTHRNADNADHNGRAALCAL